MSKRVLIIDTSVLCCWLQISGKDVAGPENDRWNYDRINSLLIQEEKIGSTFVLPIATLIETGNHIAQSPEYRHERAVSLGTCLTRAADAQSPWAAFTDQSSLWEPDKLKALASSWPPLAASKLTIGDATIKEVAEHYAKAGMHVEILTGDEGLKAYEPKSTVAQPRRRGGR